MDDALTFDLDRSLFERAHPLASTTCMRIPRPFQG